MAVTRTAAAAGKRPRRKPATGVPMPTPHDQDLDKAIAQLSLDFLQCRDFGHSWRPQTARWLDRENVYETVLRCQRCGTDRRRWLSRTGAQVGGAYEYASGYLVSGMGRLTGTDRDRVRLASVLAVLPKSQAAAG